MKTTVIVLAAMAAALAGCAAGDRGPGSAMQDDTAYPPSSTASTTSAASTSTPGAAYDGAAGGARQSTSTASNTATAQTWSGVVTAVDPILRQDAAAMGVGMAGAAAAGGTLANEGAPNDKVYRITLRADDGTTQVVVVDNMPTYKAGDRVRYRNGAVQRE